jgi:phenylalanyl-tRNA synthetase beta chain
MCSPQELGVSEDHEGIIELDPSRKLGEPLNKNDDAIFEAGITPNRPDYLAVRGIARDLAASGMGKLKTEIKYPTTITGTRKVIIKNLDRCPVYNFAEIHGIKIAPSNATIASRLAAIEINPKNAPVDATNYVCYDLGQPLHCFDADQIHGDIIVRNATDGEQFTDLFDTTHTLTVDDLVITDNDGILALAGIIGGKRGMTTDSTTNIIIESAYFEPIGIRKTRRHLGLSTDASYRFERGIDWAISAPALSSAIDIIQDSCGGTLISSTNDTLEIKNTLKYEPSIFKQKTNIDLDESTQKSILEQLGYIVNADWSVIVPSWRPDIQIGENIVSELIRIYGYNNVKILNRDTNPAQIKISATKQLLVNRGLNEIVTYGFGHSYKEKLLSDKSNILVKNPIIDTFDTARNSLVQNTLDVIANNDRFKRSNLGLFEIGTVFDADQPGNQHNQLIIARTGIIGDKIGVKHGTDASIYDVRADLMAMFPNAKVQNNESPEKWAHPFRAGVLVQDGKVIAEFAEVMPAVLKKFGIKTNVVIGIVDNITDTFIAREPLVKSDTKYSMSEFPMITRDFAFMVDNGTNESEILAAAIATDSRIVETNVFDIFDMGDGKKSIAFEIVIQPDSNLSDSDLLGIQNGVIIAVEKLGAKLRDK